MNTNLLYGLLVHIIYIMHHLKQYVYYTDKVSALSQAVGYQRMEKKQELFGTSLSALSISNISGKNITKKHLFIGSLSSAIVPMGKVVQSFQDLYTLKSATTKKLKPLISHKLLPLA